MRIGSLIAVALIGILGLFAWLVLREGVMVLGDAGDRVASATARDDSRPAAATLAAPVDPSREGERPERIEEEIGGGVEATGYVAPEDGDKSRDVALEGDADLDVTTVAPEEDHWLWSQLPPRIRVYTPRRDGAEPDVETLVAERLRRCAALSDDELRALTGDGRRPTEAEVRSDVANTLGELRRRQNWGELVVQAVASVDEPSHVRGLAPGRYVVTLQRGDSPRHPRVFDETTVDLVSGTTAVTLSIPLEEERPHVHLAGTVHFAAAWGSRTLRLDFDPVSVAGASEADERSLMISDLAPVEGKPDLYRFEVGDLLPGRYAVTSTRFDWQQDVATGAAGRDDVAIVIPDPAEVVVHLLDDKTGSPIEVPIAPGPRYGRPIERDLVIIESAQWDADAKAYRICVPAGEFEMNGRFELGESFDAVGRTRFTVRPGPNDVTVRVRHSTVLALSFQCDGEAVETWAFESGIELSSLEDPKWTRHSKIVTPRQILVRVPAAGRYRVTVKPMRGYVDVPPLIVTARQGERVDCKIELVRAR